MTEPSALAYARYFDLTRDYREDDPWQYLEYLHLPEPRPPYTNFDEDCIRISENLVSRSEFYLSKTTTDLETEPNDTADYLQQATRHEKPNVEEIYHSLLPDHHRRENYKIKVPLLSIGGGDVNKDVRRICRGIDLDRALDDVLEDYEHISRSCNQAKKQSSTVGADCILTIVHERLKQAAQPEAMSLSKKVINYIVGALSTNVDKKTRLMLIDRHLLPLHRSPSTFPVSLNETDFDVESTNVSEQPLSTDHLSAIDGAESTPSLGIMNQETLLTDRDLITYFNSAADEEIVLSSESNYNGPTQTPPADPCHSEERQSRRNFEFVTPESLHSLSCKRRKLTHDPVSPVVLRLDHVLAKLAHEEVDPELAQCRVPVPSLELPVLTLPNVDADALLEMYSLLGQSQVQRFGLEAYDQSPPFRTPSLHEMFRPELPSNTSTIDRFLGKQKKILTSDQILWKDPGIRLLDLPDEEYEQLHEGDFTIEEDAIEKLELSDKQENRTSESVPDNLEPVLRYDIDSRQKTNPIGATCSSVPPRNTTRTGLLRTTSILPESLSNRAKTKDGGSK